MVLIRAARPYADKVRFLFLQHLMVVRIRPERVGPGDGLGAASRIGVGDCYDCNVLPSVEDEVVFVAVIPVAGMADDGTCAPWREDLTRSAWPSKEADT
jgi:hypothetical protein